MIRNLKTLGLALGVVLAFAAVAASAATAAEFHSEVEHTSYVAEQDSESPNQVFVTEHGTVTCKKVSGTGTTTTKTSTQITAENISYTECTTKTIFGTINVTVDFKTNGCHFTFTPNGEVHVVCTAEEGIIISGPGCKITVPSKQSLKTATYDNKGAGKTRDVTITANVTGIKSTGTGAFCTKTGTFTNGTYTGNVTVKGFNTANEQVGIWWE